MQKSKVCVCFKASLDTGTLNFYTIHSGFKKSTEDFAFFFNIIKTA